MHLDGDAVADRILVDGRPELDHRPHIFVADRKVLVERQAAIDHRRQPVPHDFKIGGADRDRVDAHQHFGRPRLRDRLFGRQDLAWAAQHPSLHPLGNRMLVAQPGVIHHDFLRQRPWRRGF
jgi:hypothetical protein